MEVYPEAETSEETSKPLGTPPRSGDDASSVLLLLACDLCYSALGLSGSSGRRGANLRRNQSV
jgi:hypothetical protein